MKINLKKIKIHQPKVKIITGLKTITREISSGNVASNAYVICDTAGVALLGSMEYLDPNIILADWEQGDITSSGNVDSTTKIRIPNYIDLPQGVTSVYFIGNNTANKIFHC